MKKQNVSTGVDGWTLEKLQPMLERNNLVFVRFTNEGKSVVFHHKNDKHKTEQTLPLPTSNDFQLK